MDETVRMLGLLAGVVVKASLPELPSTATTASLYLPLGRLQEEQHEPIQNILTTNLLDDPAVRYSK
jgi:hypothetical protein